MNRNHLDQWLKQMKVAWESGNADAATALFAYPVTYHEEPFVPPVHTRHEVNKLWKEIEQQRHVQFAYDIICIEGDTAVVHWSVQYDDIQRQKHENLDGIFLLVFNHEGKCVMFKQWYNSLD